MVATENFCVHRAPSKFRVTNYDAVGKVTPHWAITELIEIHPWSQEYIIKIQIKVVPGLTYVS